jgi:hypothetical protein
MLNGFIALQILSLEGNRCINRNFAIDGVTTTLDTVRRDLNLCFNNNVEGPTEPEGELRRFVIEVRGPLSLRFENGTEIVRV